MAAKRVRVTEQVLKSFDDVNNSLKIIAQNQNDIAKIEADMNDFIQIAKEEAKEKTKKHEEEIKLHELMIEQYTTEHKSELKGKSLKLAFGTIGFRLSTKLILPRSINAVIENLKANGMSDCLNIKTTVNKDVLKTYDEQEIIKIGGSLDKRDTFWYETDKDTVVDSR